MSDEQKLTDLMIAWEEQRSAGLEPTLQEICRDCPELTDELAVRIEALRQTDWMFADDTVDSDGFLSLPELSDASGRTRSLAGDESGDSSLVAESPDRIDLPPTSLTADALAAASVDARLRPADEIQSIRAALPEAHSADDLARELIWTGVLTTFQASVLLRADSLPLVLGEYEIRSRIGAGGMGEVYRARHRRMKRTVALKILPPDLTSDEPALKRFNREVEIVARLEHPNIVTAHDAGEQDGTHYLIMQFVDGSNLSTLVRRDGPVSEDQAVDILLQVARGLEYAHSEGIVHRDIKPSNLLIDQRGRVKILDLGLARMELPAAQPIEQRDGLTTTGAVMGTVDYMAPEQAANSRTADHRADIYSLGCTLHFLLTGRPPYSGETMMERLLAHREQDIPSLRARRDDVTAELDAVFQRLLAKQPDERFASMTDVVAALESLTDDDPRQRDGAATAAALPGSPGSAGTAPEDSATELFNLPAGATDASSSPSLAATVDNTPHRAGAPTDESLTQTVLRDGSSGAGHRRVLKWIVLAAALLGMTYLAAAPLFQVKTRGGTLVFEGDPEVLRHITVLIDGEEVDLNVDGEEFTVSVDQPSGDVRVVQATGAELLAERFTFKVGQDRLPFTVTSRPHEMRQANTNSSPRSTRPAVATWQPGPAEGGLRGIVPRPAQLDGIQRWQVETTGPRSHVKHVAWSPDGKRIAAATDTGAVRVYDAATLELRQVLLGHQTVYRLAWSPDSRRLLAVAGSGASEVVIWDEDERASVFEGIETDGGVFDAAWSPDGTMIAAVTIDRISNNRDPRSGNVTIWTLGGERLREFPFPGGRLAWHPGGQRLAVAGGTSGSTEIRVWNLAGEELAAFPAHTKQIDDLVWSADGKRLASCGHDGMVRIWSESGEQQTEFSQPCHAIEWSPTTGRLLTAWTEVLEWNTAGEQIADALRGGGNVFDAVWSPDGQRVIAGAEWGLIVLDSQFNEIGRLTGFCRDSHVDWSPDGQQLAVSPFKNGAGPVRIVDRQGKSRVIAGTQRLRGIPHWKPDGQQIVLSHLFDGNTWLFPEDAKSEDDVTFFKNLGIARWSPDGSLLAAAFDNGKVKTLSILSGDGTPLVSWPLEEPFRFVDWHPDGEHIAVGGAEHISVYQRDGTQTQKLPGGGGRGLRWSPTDDRLLTADASDIWTRLIDFPSGKETNVVGNGLAVAWSAKGDRFAVAHPNWSGVTVWSVVGEPLGRLPGEGDTHWVAWSPDDRCLTSCGKSATVINWNAETLEPEWAYVILPEGESATFSAAGQILDGDAAVIENSFVYIIEHEDGRQQTLKPSEFQQLINQPLHSRPHEMRQADAKTPPHSVRPAEAADRDRAVAEWVLSRGGRISVRLKETGRDVAHQTSMAGKWWDEPFWVTQIDLNGEESIANEDIPQLNGLSRLAGLYIVETTRLTDEGFVKLANLPELTHLQLLRTGIGHASVQHALTFPALKDLQLMESSPVFSDETVRVLGQATQLEGLDLTINHLNRLISEEPLEKLSRLTNLRRLLFWSESVTDDGLQHLHPMKQLKSLSLHSQQLTGDGVVHLHQLPALRTLEFVQCNRFTADSYRKVAALRGLETLAFWEMPLTAGDLEQIATLANLHTLRLYKMPIGDQDLTALQPLTTLRELHLPMCQGVTDAAVEPLAALPSLTYLRVTNTKFTDAGVTALSKALPNCRIEWDGGVIEP